VRQLLGEDGCRIAAVEDIDSGETVHAVLGDALCDGADGVDCDPREGSSGTGDSVEDGDDGDDGDDGGDEDDGVVGDGAATGLPSDASPKDLEPAKSSISERPSSLSTEASAVPECCASPQPRVYTTTHLGAEFGGLNGNACKLRRRGKRGSKGI